MQLVMLDQFMRRIAAQAGTAPPTPVQVLAIFRKLNRFPSFLTYSLFSSLLTYAPYDSQIDDIPRSPKAQCTPRFTADDRTVFFQHLLHL